MSEKLKVAAMIALIFGAYGLMGTLDYEEELRQEQHYCQMVREGHWPNFKPEIDCKRIDPQHMTRGIKL